MDYRLDMQAVLALVEEAASLAGAIDGQHLDVDIEVGRGRKSDPAKAVMSHELLYLQTLLTLAAAEVGMRYHELKGRTDPRWDEG